MNDLNNILSLTRGHDLYMANRIDLLASNCWTSRFPRLAMASNLSNNYCIGLPGKRIYGGCIYIDMIEREVYSLLQRIFNMKHVVVQFLSGMQANIGAYHAILEPGDTIIAADTKHGGHYSHTAIGPLRFFSPRILPLPFDESCYNVDVDRLEDLIKKEKPKLLILGWSEFLFPHPLKQIRQICDDHNVIMMYDMSHVIGLIAGHAFQPEANRYADIITSSTGKSLHGPDHGIAMFNDESLKPKILEAVMPLLTSNTHPHEVAALGITLAEMIAFGKAYAKQVIANAKALGRALHNEGLNVLYPELGFTESHTLLIEYKEATKGVTLLDRAGILANASPLPWNNDDEVTGIRFGTQVVTRHGMKESNMPEIARAIKEVLLNGKEPEIVHHSLVQICFSTLKETAYSFDHEFPGHGDWFKNMIKTYRAETPSAILRSNPAFAECTLFDIESVSDRFELVKFDALQEIFKAGTPSDCVYFITNGTVDIVDVTKDGERIVISQEEGTHFGELGVMTEQKRKYTARSKTPVLLLKIDSKDFLDVLNRFSSVKKYFDRYVISLHERNVESK